MTTLQDTIYPRLKAVVAPHDLERVYTPTSDEIELAQRMTIDAVAALGFLIHLKTFQRLGYFVALHTVPTCIVQHIAQAVEHSDLIPHLPAYDRSGSRRRHQARIRALRNVKPFRAGGQQVVQRVVADAAVHTEKLDDLINLAIEELLRQYYELPGFTTLATIAQRQRAKSYTGLYTQVMAAVTPDLQELLDALLVVEPTTQRSPWDVLKDSAGRPTLGNLHALAERLAWFAPYQPVHALVRTLPDAKLRHFATEAMAYDIHLMRELKPARRYTLACALLTSQHAQTLDDVAGMFIRRMRSIQHAAKTALETYQQQHQARTDRLITALRDLVVGYQQPGSVEARFAGMDQVLKDRSDALLQDCEAHLTYAGNNFASFVWRPYRSHRSTVFRLLKLLPFHAASRDSGLQQAIAFVLTHERSKAGWLSVLPPGAPATAQPLLDLSWIPVGWWRIVTDLATRDQVPHRVNRRHFEACVASHILTALHTGDLYIVSADRFGDPFPRLCSQEEYDARIGTYGEQLGLPVDPDAFVMAQQQWLTALAETTDQTFPTNDQVTLVKGRPVIRRPARHQEPTSVTGLKQHLAARQQSRSIVHALAMTDHWLHWTDVFGPLSGFAAKIDQPVARYLATVFCYGCQIGPTATAKALGSVDRKQLTWIDHHHISEENLDQASQVIIAAYHRCSLPRLWGSLQHASIDGTKWEVYEQNLLSERHIRYGGYGGIALYLLSGTYIALMANFIACSAWEGHYLLDVLDQNQSVIQPTILHSDTQGQSEAIFGLAFLRGIELMPRIRNWQDLLFYRPAAHTTYQHIDAVFADKVIDWELIRTHLPDLLRIALSIKEGRITPSTILRTISTGSSKLAQAYRELGRVRRTGFFLRLMADPEMRAVIHKETNKSEHFNNFVKWLGFGSAGVIRENDRGEQQKAIKYTLLLANAMLFYTTVTLANDLRALIKEGYGVEAAAVAGLSPYATNGLERFGTYSLTLESIPEPLDYDTPVINA
ncbi:MAG: Tn3 family transposase [Herpetosiphon sp.]